MLHRNGPAKVVAFDKTRAGERLGFLAAILFFHDRTWCNSGERRTHDALVAKHVVVRISGGRVGNGSSIERVLHSIGSDHASLYFGSFFIPRFPIDGDLCPAIRTFRSQYFVKDVLGAGGLALPVEHEGFLILKNQHIGAGRGRYLGSACI